MNNQSFSKIGIVVIVVILLSGGVFAWQYFGAPKEEVRVPEKMEEGLPEEVIEEETAAEITKDIDKYLHKDAILEERITPMMRESGYAGISVGEAVMYVIQHLETRGVKNIEICEAHWIAAPLKGYLINGKGSFNIEDKHYSTFRIGIRDGAEGNVGDDFVFIARGEDDEGKVIWYPEPGPDFHPAEGEIFPEEFFVYEFLGDREKFESLSSRFK